MAANSAAGKALHTQLAFAVTVSHLPHEGCARYPTERQANQGGKLSKRQAGRHLLVVGQHLDQLEPSVD